MTLLFRHKNIFRQDFLHRLRLRHHRSRNRCQNGLHVAEIDERTVTVADSSHQSKAPELEGPFTFPEGTTPDGFARSLMQSVDIDQTPGPERRLAARPATGQVAGPDRMQTPPERDGDRACPSTPFSRGFRL